VAAVEPKDLPSMPGPTGSPAPFCPRGTRTKKRQQRNWALIIVSAIKPPAPLQGALVVRIRPGVETPGSTPLPLRGSHWRKR
jgi:hypothetical protein